MTALLGLRRVSARPLLWVNLVTDGPPATALGFNPPRGHHEAAPRHADDELITPWVMVRYMVIGLYVGFATVGIFVYWYVFYDWSGHNQPLVSHVRQQLGQVLDLHGLRTGLLDVVLAGRVRPVQRPVRLFPARGKATASTLSLSVLVVIEMLNALNALSEDGSLLQMPPWANPWLLVAMFVSIGLHFLILTCSGWRPSSRSCR